MTPTITLSDECSPGPNTPGSSSLRATRPPPDAAHAGAAAILGVLLDDGERREDAPALRDRIAAVATDLGYPNAVLVDPTLSDDAGGSATRGSRASSPPRSSLAQAAVQRPSICGRSSRRACALRRPRPSAPRRRYFGIAALRDLVADVATFLALPERELWAEPPPAPMDLALAGGTSSGCSRPDEPEHPARPRPPGRPRLRGDARGRRGRHTRRRCRFRSGLFGEWGAGKKLLHGAARRSRSRSLAASERPRSHRNIAQIGFNAWHYADTNLWASLGDEIFEQLDELEAPREGGKSRTWMRSSARRRARVCGPRWRTSWSCASNWTSPPSTPRPRRRASRKPFEEAAGHRRLSAGDFAHAVANSVAVKKQLGQLAGRRSV